MSWSQLSHSHHYETIQSVKFASCSPVIHLIGDFRRAYGSVFSVAVGESFSYFNRKYRILSALLSAHGGIGDGLLLINTSHSAFYLCFRVCTSHLLRRCQCNSWVKPHILLKKRIRFESICAKPCF